MSTLILLALVGGLVVVAVKAVTWIGGMLSDHEEKTAQSSTAKPVDILQCNADDLDVVLTPSSTRLPEGEPLEVSVQISNKGENACSLATGDVTILLRDGDQSVWTPTKCSSSWDKLLLLAPGKPWNSTLSWNGKLYSECEGVTLGSYEDGSAVAATPGEGTYQLVAKVLGDRRESVTPIVID